MQININTDTAATTNPTNDIPRPFSGPTYPYRSQPCAATTNPTTGFPPALFRANKCKVNRNKTSQFDYDLLQNS